MLIRNSEATGRSIGGAPKSSRNRRRVARAADREDLLRKVRAHKPDVAVVDIRMPSTSTRG
jgi:CheY-like chemotaxis protein